MMVKLQPNESSNEMVRQFHEQPRAAFQQTFPGSVFLDKVERHVNETSGSTCKSPIDVFGNDISLAENVYNHWIRPQKHNSFGRLSYSDVAFDELKHRVQGRRYFIAALLHNNEEVLPFWQRELIKVLVVLANDERTNVFVSVYESGSTDSTQLWLSQLEAALTELGIRSRIHVGLSIRNTFPGRIEHLAALRNEALRPMFEDPEPWDEVIYLNDVFFCSEGVVEMLLSGDTSEADMVCATDYVGEKPGCSTCADLRMYDIWVSHDLSGRRFDNEPPFIVGSEQARKHHAEGAPYQVYSCWNGIVIMRADLFLQERLRFRHAMPVECGVSECELICRDMWAAGRHRIMIHPNVQTAYELGVFQLALARLHDKSQKSWIDNLVELSSSVTLPGWTGAKSKGLFGQVRWRTKARATTKLECCSLQPGEDIVEFDKCFSENVTHWYTAFGVPRAVSSSSLTATNMVDGLTTASEIGDIVKTRHCPDGSARSAAANIGAVPALMTQIGRSDSLDSMSLRARQAILSWIMHNPCHRYTFLTDAKIESFVKTSFPQYVRDFTTLNNGGEKADLARYLYMYANGGIYADTDTIARGPASDWILPSDRLVVGLEADFTKVETAVEWVYARQKSLSLHCFAAAPRHNALLNVIETVIQNIRDTDQVYWQIVQRGHGLPSHLSTIFKTGSGPFTDGVLASSDVRVLGLLALSGRHSQGDHFYNLNIFRSMQDERVFVEHMNLGSWLRPSVFMPMAITNKFNFLASDSALLGGQWFAAYDGVSPPAEPIWYLDTIEDPASVTKPVFLWLSMEGELRVGAGYGPEDPHGQILWRQRIDINRVPGSSAELVLQSTGMMSVRFTSLVDADHAAGITHVTAWTVNNQTREGGPQLGDGPGTPVGCFFLVLTPRGRLAIYRGQSPERMHGDPNTHCCDVATVYQPVCSVRILHSDHNIKALQQLISPDRRFYAVTMPQGALCVFDSRLVPPPLASDALPDLSIAKWCTLYGGNSGAGPHFTVLQGDGNLCTYKGSPENVQNIVWSSSQANPNLHRGPYTGMMENDASVRIYDSLGQQVWRIRAVQSANHLAIGN
jgi:alpha-1,3-mannosyltransferase